jgi:plasmid stabilization system protein ParE
MSPIRFHPEAERELLDARHWYSQRSEVAAQAFALEIDRALGAIAGAPERWPLRPSGERRLTLSRFLTQSSTARARARSSLSPSHISGVDLDIGAAASNSRAHDSFSTRIGSVA